MVKKVNTLKLTLRNILNRLVWDPEKKQAEYQLTFIHRGAPSGIKTITCDMIVTVESSWFTFTNKGDETLIPFHRICEIKHLETRKILYKKM